MPSSNSCMLKNQKKILYFFFNPLTIWAAFIFLILLLLVSSGIIKDAILVFSYILLAGFFASKCKAYEDSVYLLVFALIIGVILIASSTPHVSCDENGNCAQLEQSI